MGFFAKLGSFFCRRERELTPEERRQLESVKQQIRARCRHFRSLLSANKKALETMSEMEERLSGERPFDTGYVKEAGARSAAAVFRMVRELNTLTGNAWPDLADAFKRVSSRMEELAEPSRQVEYGPFVIPLAETGLAQMPEVGGKMANLGEVASGAGLPVPAGFSITVSAYRYFLEQNGLGAEIERHIRSTDMEDLDALFSLSAKLQQLVTSAPLPVKLRNAIEDEVELLVVGSPDPDIRLALRSSAVGEDALGASFAGQYKSELNVLPEEACDIWKEIVASKYTVAALSYRYRRGIPDEAAPMSVGVLRMVRALAGGVAYSNDPVGRGGEAVVLNSVPGLPAAVVDGRVTPDSFLFSHTHPPKLVSKEISVKASRLDSDLESSTGMRVTPLSEEEGGKPSITDAQAAEVARITLALEEYYNKPQDAEWAIERFGGGERVIVLQSRPLQVEGRAPADTQEPPAAAPGAPLLAGGIGVSAGVAIGKVFVVRRDADMLSFPEGAVLVVERASPRWAPLLPRAAAMIAESGGMAGHLASVAREYRLPAIFGLKGAFDALEKLEGEVTVDASRSCVYKGACGGLLAGQKPKPRLMEGSPVMKRLEALASCVVPLHLLDPNASEFSPKNCRSLHDITRFCHEKAASFMFDGDASISNSSGKQLKAGAKLQYWVIDMDDGFSKDVPGPVVDIKDIASKPMLALWDGLIAVPWMGPPSTSASGFMSVVFESAMNPDLEITAPTTMAERNYFIVSKDYMLLQARYGYHFCTVEALASGADNENFVSFQFKGGAASFGRRKLRAKMIASLLEVYGFRVDVRGDSLFAVAAEFSAREILLKTKLVGYLLLHTRQSDMIMENPAQAAAFKEKLEGDMRGIVRKEEGGMQSA